VRLLSYPRKREDRPQRADAARAPPARTPAGLTVRIAQRIPALTLGMLLNRLNGRPTHALPAYNGR
jgi:hypothetical protein